MKRRASIVLVVLTLLASVFGMATPVAASLHAVDSTITDATAPPHDTVAVNAPPVAVDDPAIPACFTAEFGGSFPLPEDWHQQAFIGACGATTNDTDSDGTIVAWHVDTLPAHGAIEWLPDHPEVFGYTPNHDWSTLPGNVAGGDWVSDSFTYHVVDDQGASSNQATYRFWIAPINDAPTFTAGPAIVTVRGSAPHSAAWATAVSPGPHEDTQNVHFQNTNIDLHGTVGLFSAAPSIAPDGTLSFTPAPGKVGRATVTAYAKDDGGLEHYSGVPDTADDASDPVTFDIVVQANGSPVAVDDTPPAIPEDAGASAINVLANDTDVDGDTLTIASVGAADHGTVVNNITDVTYSPDPNYNGLDSFTYTIDDSHGGTATATVNVTITAVNDAPLAVDDTPASIAEDAGATPIDVLANDTDTDLDTLTITGVTQGARGTVAITNSGADLTYTPNPNANGSDSFTYTISDGNGGADTATVNIAIGAVNDPPVAGVDAVTVTEDQSSAAPINVLANDTDVENDTLTVTSTSTAAKGAVAITGGGTGVTYKPNANAYGSDSFTYTVSDGVVSTIGTVNVTITPANDPPNAVNDGVPTPFKVYVHAGAKAIPVLANDTSLPDAPETLHITKVTQGAHGTVAITGGATGLSYTPIGTATGIDVFKYTISDGHGGTDTASVQVTVARDTTAPKATINGLTNKPITGSTKRRLTLTWTISETQSGIRSEQLQRRTDSGSWITVALSSSSVRTATFTVARGHTYAFRVRATDRSGNVGLYVGRSVKI